MFNNFLDYFQIIVAILVIFLVILQPSKGSDLGSMAGGNSSNGNKTYVDPLTKITGFLVLSLIFSSFFVNYIEKEARMSSVVIEQTTNTPQK